jgi:hypothetical protein
MKRILLVLLLLVPSVICAQEHKLLVCHVASLQAAKPLNGLLGRKRTFIGYGVVSYRYHAFLFSELSPENFLLLKTQICPELNKALSPMRSFTIFLARKTLLVEANASFGLVDTVLQESIVKTLKSLPLLQDVQYKGISMVKRKVKMFRVSHR